MLSLLASAALVNVQCAKVVDLKGADVGLLRQQICPVVNEELLECEADIEEAEKDLAAAERQLQKCFNQ